MKNVRSSFKQRYFKKQSVRNFKKFLSDCLASYILLSFTIWAHSIHHYKKTSYLVVYLYIVYINIYIYIYGIVLTTAFTVKFVMAHNFILLQLSPFDLRVNREGWLCIYVFIWYLYVFIYIFIWHVETDKKIFCNLLFWSAWSTLVTLCPFIRQPFWKFTLRVRVWTLLQMLNTPATTFTNDSWTVATFMTLFFCEKVIILYNCRLTRGILSHNC